MFRFLKLVSQHIQARDVEKAMDAFTSAVQLDPDNGEAWNNIACLYDLSHLEHASSIFFSSSPFTQDMDSHLIQAFY